MLASYWGRRPSRTKLSRSQACSGGSGGSCVIFARFSEKCCQSYTFVTTRCYEGPHWDPTPPMLMALHRAAVHAKTFSTCAARRHTSSHHNLSPSLVHASVRATKRCSSNPQYLGSPTTPHTCGIRTAPSPATTAQRSARRSPDTTQILESSRRRTVSNRASASGTTAAEVSSTQLTDADPEELSSDSQGEPASDARLDPGLYLVATPIGDFNSIGCNFLTSPDSKYKIV